jgi:transposase InsO family protein
VSWAIEEKNYSQRRACGLVRIDPKTYRYRRRRDDDSVLRTRLKELAAQRRRFGYRRLHLLIARDGVTVNHKKLYRIYREEKLVVRKRGGRRLSQGHGRAPPKCRFDTFTLEICGPALTACLRRERHRRSGPPSEQFLMCYGWELPAHPLLLPHSPAVASIL